MQIVPRADELVVEAKVAPNDIDQIATGAKAIVKVMAGNQRTTPEIIGVITRVSADLAREQRRSSKIPRSRPPPITPFASRCRRRRWPASRTSASFPACRSRPSSRPTSAPRCSTCSSRCATRSRAPSASADRTAAAMRWPLVSLIPIHTDIRHPAGSIVLRKNFSPRRWSSPAMTTQSIAFGSSNSRACFVKQRLMPLIGGIGVFITLSSDEARDAR